MINPQKHPHHVTATVEIDLGADHTSHAEMIVRTLLEQKGFEIISIESNKMEL